MRRMCKRHCHLKFKRFPHSFWCVLNIFNKNNNMHSSSFVFLLAYSALFRQRVTRSVLLFIILYFAVYYAFLSAQRLRIVRCCLLRSILWVFLFTLFTGSHRFSGSKCICYARPIEYVLKFAHRLAADWVFRQKLLKCERLCPCNGAHSIYIPFLLGILVLFSICALQWPHFGPQCMHCIQKNK